MAGGGVSACRRPTPVEMNRHAEPKGQRQPNREAAGFGGDGRNDANGGRDVVWFVADPLRSDLALFSRGRPRAYRWPFDPSTWIGGVRPSDMDWHVIERPEWYLGEGWAITPERIFRRRPGQSRFTTQRQEPVLERQPVQAEF